MRTHHVPLLACGGALLAATLLSQSIAARVPGQILSKQASNQVSNQAPAGQTSSSQPPAADRASDTSSASRPPAQPVLVKDINPAGSSDPAAFIRFRGATCFRANDGQHGAELWKTNGTAEGTTLVADINPGDASGAPDTLTTFAGRIYFAASHAQSGRELWASDGTADGTTLVDDINPGAADGLPAVFARFGGSLYFRAQDTAGLELWKTQGTAATTAQVADLHPGTEGSIPTYPTVFRNALFFSADDSFTPGIGFDRELWKTDGTAAGTVRIKDINPGPLPSIPGELTRLGQLLIFKGGTAEAGGELWRTDGTEAGTVPIADMNPGAADSSPMGVAFRNGLLFNAGDAEHGRELWFSDGTEAGTRLVKDINPGAENSSPLALTVAGRDAYFAIIEQTGVGDGGVATELWKTDGTEGGTQRVWQAPGRFNGYTIRTLSVSGGLLLFSAPTSADPNGLATDFELYALRLRDARDIRETPETQDADGGGDTDTTTNTLDEASERLVAERP